MLNTIKIVPKLKSGFEIPKKIFAQKGKTAVIRIKKKIFFQIFNFFRKNCRIYVFGVADSKNRIFEPIKNLFDF